MRRKIIKTIFGILLLVSIERFTYFQTAGFRLEKIAPDHAYESSVQTVAPSSEIKEALNQPYTFLGSGVQCYAFLSADKKSVLKLFKHYHMWPSSKILRQLPWPSSWLKQTLEERGKRMDQILNSCQLAYDSYRKESALLYIHLKPTTDLKIKTQIIDKLGISYEIDLDQMEFVLQERAELVPTHLNELMRQGEVQKAKEAISSLLDLILARSAQGIANLDPIVHRNFGFIENRAVEIDIGSFKLSAEIKKPYFYKRELFFETLQLKEWCQAHSPQLLDFLNEQVALRLCEETPL
jgi:hypothetical protein